MEGLDFDERQIYLYLASIFDRDEPQSFYLDYYELADGTKGYLKDVDPRYYAGNPRTKPHQWERFLELPEIYRYRQGKIGKLGEYDAIKAMQSLKGKTDVNAVKEIIKASKFMGNGVNKREKIILTYVKPKEIS
jgi:hypothetical protein